MKGKNITYRVYVDYRMPGDSRDRTTAIDVTANGPTGAGWEAHRLFPAIDALKGAEVRNVRAVRALELAPVTAS